MFEAKIFLAKYFAIKRKKIFQHDTHKKYFSCRRRSKYFGRKFENILRSNHGKYLRSYLLIIEGVVEEDGVRAAVSMRQDTLELLTGGEALQTVDADLVIGSHLE